MSHLAWKKQDPGNSHSPFRTTPNWSRSRTCLRKSAPNVSSETRRKMMKTLAGLWIDHREAVIVLMSLKGQETKRIKSNAEEPLCQSGNSPSRVSSQPHMAPADDSQEREYGVHLAKYYDEVISCLLRAEAILVFGPGEAKGELRKRIEQSKLNLRIKRFETTDRMTENQVSQSVRRHYLPPSSTESLWRNGAAANRRSANTST
jgi:hypothetical protein